MSSRARRPTAAQLLQSRVGETVATLTGRPNRILEVSSDQVIVGTGRSPLGEPVPLEDVDDALELLWRDGEVRIDPDTLGHRSSFVGAVLLTLPGATALRNPARVRLGGGRVGARNPNWETDELILALDLYLREGLLDDGDERVIELSGVLNALPIHSSRPDATRFRNPNGVAMKLANFAALDPTYPGAGLRAGSRRDQKVWDRFHADREELTRIAARLRSGVADGILPMSWEDGEEEALEGRILFRQHRMRERDRALVLRKKAAAVRSAGLLRCEVCGVAPVDIYGGIGDSAIECHHILPLSQAGVRRTVLSDLALVCSNCHRVLHRTEPWSTPAELRLIVSQVARRAASPDADGSG